MGIFDKLMAVIKGNTNAEYEKFDAIIKKNA